jgi:hypothetical protein
VTQDIPVTALPSLPLGFILHEEVVCADVLLCIRTILRLQILTTSHASDATTIENLQARIEARLVFEEQRCKDAGLIAECCRLAVYIVSYMSNSATWKSAFVPLRLAEKLLDYLEQSITADMWQYRRDLFLWLLLVGASVGRGQNCFATDLEARYEGFIDRTTRHVKDWNELKNGPKALNNVLRKFIYAEDWVAQRHTIPNWTKLEHAVFLCGSGDVDIGMDTDTLLQELLPDTSLFE